MATSKVRKRQFESFEVSPEFQKRYREEAEKAGLSVSEYIRRAIELQISRIEFRGQDVLFYAGEDEHGKPYTIPYSARFLAWAIEIENFVIRNPELIRSLIATLSSHWESGKKSRKRKMRKGEEKIQKGRIHKSRGGGYARS